MVLIQTIFIIINLMIALYDFSFFRIPNLLLGSLLVLYAVTAPFYIDLETLMYSSALCLGVLVITFVLFSLKIIGGGDAKYLTVSSLWFGLAGIIPFVIIFSLVGAVIAIMYLIFRDHIQRLSDWVWQKMQVLETQYSGLQYVWAGSGAGPELGKRENISTKSIPYGIAIAAAAIFMMANYPLTGL